MSGMMNQILRPKFVLVAMILLVSWNKQIQVSASPIPDDPTAAVSNFIERTKNTFSTDPKDNNKEQLSTTEIVLIGVAAFLVFMFLLCCIGYCLCECIKDLICCICCCSCLRN